MVTVVVTAIGGALLSASLGRKLPPPNTLEAPVAPPGGLYGLPAGGTHAARSGSGAIPSDAAGSPRQTEADSSAGHDRVSTAAERLAPAVSERSDAVVDRVSGKVGGAGESAGRRAEESVDATSEIVRDARARAASTAAPEPAAQQDGVNARVRDAAREAGEAARGMQAPTADAGSEAKVEAVRPARLEGPREDRGDDLKKIKGVGPKLEATLQGLGFWHFDQIAAWTDAELAWVDEHLEGFNGRASRDEWVAQAKVLAMGGETEFSDRVDKGEVYD